MVHVEVDALMMHRGSPELQETSRISVAGSPPGCRESPILAGRFLNNFSELRTGRL